MNNRIYQSPDVYTLISNRLMTSLHALQSSLATLRSHKPNYTPRTGFVWPIAEPSSSSENPSKQRGEDEEAPSSSADDPELSGPPAKRRSAATHERQQNNMLLWNAMHATAVHASASFTLPAAAPESTAPDTPVLGSGARSSATPAPAPTRAATPRQGATPQEQPPAKGPPGGGKKKKKRTATMSTGI